MNDVLGELGWQGPERTVLAELIINVDETEDRLILLDQFRRLLSSAPSRPASSMARMLRSVEVGLLSIREVSERLGSRSPNRSYAFDQHSRGKLIAVRRGGGMRYPGFQIDPVEQSIRPVMRTSSALPGKRARGDPRAGVVQLTDEWP